MVIYLKHRTNHIAMQRFSAKRPSLNDYHVAKLDDRYLRSPYATPYPPALARRHQPSMISRNGRQISTRSSRATRKWHNAWRAAVPGDDDVVFLASLAAKAFMRQTAG